MRTTEEVIEEILRTHKGVSVIDPQTSTVSRLVDGEVVTKRTVQLKGGATILLELADLSQIDTRYYHPNGDPKTREEVQDTYAAEKKAEQDRADEAMRLFDERYAANPPAPMKIVAWPAEMPVGGYKAFAGQPMK